MLFLLFLLPSVFYSAFLIFLALGYFRRPYPDQITKEQNISIIVAARNEEENLDHLLTCLSSQDYPLDCYEIIIVDDRSNDSTPKMLAKYAEQISNMRYTRIEQENPNILGKKNAINTGIGIAKYDVLAFTDADCSPGKKWLKEINRFMTPDTDMLAGYSPLEIYGKPLPSLLKKFERTVYAAVACGSFGWKLGMTCTATNFIYRRSLFEKVHGFESIGHVRSGDDDLMMLKMMKYTRTINYMTTPDSYVPARYSLRLDSHMALETRRASKFRYFPMYLKLIAFLVFIFYFLFYLVFVLTLTGHLYWYQFIMLLIIKTMGEMCFVLPFLVMVDQVGLFWAYPVLTVYYPFHFLFFALKGTFGSYKWKEN
ncbi:MAG TPA: glycosyltransferase [Candidatus Cloacimonadota bacterium]|nr:glycosyltransferase [Candidatus Cloacimonadota bacterium]HPT71073.1 glycosyltransferase [Candidatus Cloacimonadota bacterium]